MPSVPSAFCLIAIAIRFFSALVSLRAASIFRLTSLCSLRASSRFSARVPMPSSLDTCSSLCKLVMESVPISTWTEDKKISSHVQYVEMFMQSLQAMVNHITNPSYIIHPSALTCVGGCWVAKPRSNLRMKGRAGLERNFFHTSASRLRRRSSEEEMGFRQ